MRWEYHLSKATASRAILNSLLTIHYLFTERNDDIDTAKTWELLPVSFLNASLAWFRVGSDLFFTMRRICLDGNFWLQKQYGHQNADDGNKGDEDDEGDDYWYNLDENEADHNPDEEFKGEGFESWCEEVIAAKRDGVIVGLRAQVES